MAECKCGCGKQFERLDSRGRIRLWAHGHSGRLRRETRTCICGCDRTFECKITSKKRYLKYHQNKIVGFQKGYNPWNKGLSFLPKNFFDRIYGKGKTHRNWKGGITSENHRERLRFRHEMQELIFIRDRYRCQVCGQEGGNLHIDHVKQWAEHPELRFKENNCRTVCRACHYYITFKKKLPHWSNWGISVKKGG